MVAHNRHVCSILYFYMPCEEFNKHNDCIHLHVDVFDDDRLDLASYGDMRGVHLYVIASKVHRAPIVRYDRVVRTGIPLTKVEDESRTDEYFEEHDERDAYIRVELLKRWEKKKRQCVTWTDSGETTYGDTPPQTHDDTARHEISTVDISRIAVRVMRIGYSHEKVTETVASQDTHKRVYLKDFLITGVPAVLYVLKEHACGQEKKKEFETKEGNENVYKVGIDTVEFAEMLAGDDGGGR